MEWSNLKPPLMVLVAALAGLAKITERQHAKKNADMRFQLNCILNSHLNFDPMHHTNLFIYVERTVGNLSTIRI